jgi:hypothetical protein
MMKACKTPHFIKSTSREEHHIRTDVDNFRALGKEYDPELFMINLNHRSRFAGFLPWELSSNPKHGRMKVQQIMWLA